MKCKVTYLLLALLASVSLRAQSITPSSTTTNIGRDFWVMFLYNNGDQSPHQTTLTAVGDSNATITVSNPSTGWSTTASLTANQSVQITIPLASSTSPQSNTAQTKNLGIHVTSTTSIALYASNYRNMCNDITMVYPTHVLGTHYILQDYQGDAAHSSVTGAEVGFVATEDNTVLTMTPPCNLLDNTLVGGSMLTVNLMQGESYQLIASSSGSFSGMEVTSNGKPFAAFQGNRVAYIPTGSGGAGHIFEQAVPTDYWGKEYMVVSTYGRMGDQVRITSSEDDCAVYANGTLLCTLQKGDSYEDIIAGGGAKYYHSTGKICIGRYLRSNSSGGAPGDPASVILPPVDQGLQTIRFDIHSYSGFSNYYVNIVAHHSFVSGITLDGNSISSQFSSAFDTAYSVAWIAVTPGVHLLESSLGPVVVDGYGLGSYAGYANTLGRSFIKELPTESPCPAVTNMGTDFWWMFLYNMNINSGSWTSHRQLIVAGEQSASIHVSGPAGVDEYFNLTGGSYNDQHEYGTNTLTIATPFSGGYHVTSTQPVYAYARNYIDATLDVATLLPTSSLDTHYIVQDYPSQQYGGEVGFVATEDNTVLTMTVPCNINGTSITAGTTLTPTLMEGEAYLLLGTGSLSGMEVTSNGKPFAMFQGAWNPSVPENVGGRDHMYEQALPVRYWGTDFIVASTVEQSVNHIRITASEDSCTVTCNGTSLGTLNAGQTITHSCTANSTYAISTGKAAMVSLCLGSQTSAGTGDPSMVIIPPLDRGVCESRFVLRNTEKISLHRIYVICDMAYCGGLTLDGNALSPSSEIVNGYRIYRINTTQGGHTLSNSEGPFIAYAYGLGYYESYAFPLGFRLDTVQYEPRLVLRDTLAYQDTVCAGQAYNGYGFSISGTETSSAGTLERWRTSSSGDTVHNYHLTLTVLPAADTNIFGWIVLGDTIFYNGDTLATAGIYTYTFTGENGCDSTVRLSVSYIIDTVVYYDTVCQGSVYTGHGFTVMTTQAVGTSNYYDSFGDSLHLYCLRLTVLPVPMSETTILIIMGDTLFYNGDTLTERGDYSYHFTAANGCDSTLTLHLEYEEISLTASADGICPGDSVTLNATGTHAAWWSATPPDASLAAQQGQTSIIVRPQQTTSYCLYSSEGGSLIDCVVVGVEPPPTLCVELSLPFIDFDFPTVYFTDCSEGSTSSTWCFDDGITLNRAYSRRQFHHPLPDSVVVTLQTCNRYHCCADTTFSIPKKIRSVWWPNVFTPDEEQNNRFGCTVTFEIVAFEMHIYNRQGLLVYHTTDPSATWDGTREGESCPQGAYVYHWHVKDAYGYVKNGTGTVTLIR